MEEIKATLTFKTGANIAPTVQQVLSELENAIHLIIEQDKEYILTVEIKKITD